MRRRRGPTVPPCSVERYSLSGCVAAAPSAATIHRVPATHQPGHRHNSNQRKRRELFAPTTHTHIQTEFKTHTLTHFVFPSTCRASATTVAASPDPTAMAGRLRSTPANANTPRSLGSGRRALPPPHCEHSATTNTTTTTTTTTSHPAPVDQRTSRPCSGSHIHTNGSTTRHTHLHQPAQLGPRQTEAPGDPLAVVKRGGAGVDHLKDRERRSG